MNTETRNINKSDNLINELNYDLWFYINKSIKTGWINLVKQWLRLH